MSHLKIPEVAGQLNVSVDTVRRLIDRGELKAIRVGRVLRVSSDELRRFTRDHVHSGSAA